MKIAIALILPAMLAACASFNAPSMSTAQLCATYYYGAPRTQQRVVEAREELIRRGESECVRKAEDGGKV